MAKTTYRIRNWDELYENRSSRDVKSTRWVPIPNKQDGMGYARLVTRPNGAAYLGCWLAILQVASKMPTRGLLVDDTGEPVTAQDLAIRSRLPEDLIAETLEACSSDKIGWIEIVENNEKTNFQDADALSEETDGETPETDAVPTVKDKKPSLAKHEGREGREGKEGKEVRTWPGRFKTTWNENCGKLPTVKSMSPDRCDKLRSRLRSSHVQEAGISEPEDFAPLVRWLASGGSDGFYAGNNDRKWKAHADYVLASDKKLLELLEKMPDEESGAHRSLPVEPEVDVEPWTPPPVDGFQLFCWEQTMRALERELDAESFDAWISPIRFGGYADDVLTLIVPSAFFQDWIKTSFEDEIARHAGVNFEKAKVPEIQYRIAAQEQPEGESLSTAEGIAPQTESISAPP